MKFLERVRAMIGMGPCWLVLGYDCNNRCQWCYASQELSSHKRMTKETLIDALVLLEGLQVSSIVLIGGEPTVSELLPLAVTESIARGMEPTMVTNGRRLSNMGYARSLFDSGLRKLSISIESTDPGKHDSITQREGSYSEALKGVENAVALGMTVDTVTTISYENLDEVARMIPWAKSLGVTSVGYNVETPNVDDPAPSKLTVKAAVETMARLLEIADLESLDIHFAASVPLCLLPKTMQEDPHFRGSCFVYYGDGLVVDSNGSIIPCVHWIGAEIDNIYNPSGSPKSTSDFLDGWNNGLASEFRSSLWRYPANSCVGCQSWDAGRCTGGCPLLRLNRDLSSEIDPR